MIFKKSYFNPPLEVTLDDSICLEATVRPVCSSGLGVPPRGPPLKSCSLYSQTRLHTTGAWVLLCKPSFHPEWRERDLGCPGHPVSDSEALRFGGGGGIAITSI